MAEVNNDAKLIVGIVVGSILLLVLAVVGFGNLNKQTESGGSPQEIQGEERLKKEFGETKVVVVEFSDFQCPACRAAQGLVDQLEGREGIKLVYRHFPLSTIHKNAQLAAEAAEAAQAQGKFWEMHDLLFERQQEWAEEKNPETKFIEYAGELELDKDIFTKALVGHAYRDLVISDYQEGLRLKVNATPTFFVNGRKTSTTELMKIVEEEFLK